ncbi:MAG TPA: TlpA disulfide reductase family protein, partial [Leptolinea sp.]
MKHSKTWLYVSGAFFCIFILLAIIILTRDSNQNKIQPKNPFMMINSRPKNGSPAPVFELNSLAGEKTTLAQFKGKPVIINFWATWCAPCKIEMPLLQSVADKYGSNLVILAINFEESKAIVTDYVDQNKLQLPILMDEFGKTA